MLNSGIRFSGFRFGAASFMLMCCAASPVTASPAVPQDMKFTAQVGKVRLQSKLIEKGKKDSDSVSVNVKYLRFSPPLVIDDVRKSSSQSNPEIETLRRYYIANLTGKASEILEFWEPGSRDRVAKMLNDPALFKLNREASSKDPSLRVVGILFQNGTESVMCGRPKREMGMNLKKVGNKFQLVNEPADDLQLAIVEAALAEGAGK